MHLLAEDVEKIGHILAKRYFTEQGWQYTDLKLSLEKIIESVETVNEQYSKYPYMSRDWYVENSADKSLHMASRWEELNKLSGLLKTWPEQFDFLLKISTSKSLCIVKTPESELNDQQQRAIADARKAGYNIYIFRADIPGSMDFELEEVAGGISGRGVFR